MTFAYSADAVAVSLSNLWAGVLGFIPSLIAALVVLIVGLIVASGLGTLVEKILDAVRLDAGLRKLGIEPYFQRAGLQLRGAHFFGRIVYWFLVIVFILAASDVLGLYALSDFLRQVLFYIPNVVIAILIMLAAVVLANFLRRLVTASVLSARLHAAGFLGMLTWWAAVIVGFLAALEQLGIARMTIDRLETGLIAMLALAGGLAFGLGGREYAAHLLARLQQRTEIPHK
jgi:hypothetical protein